MNSYNIFTLHNSIDDESDKTTKIDVFYSSSVIKDSLQMVNIEEASESDIISGGSETKVKEGGKAV
jgi:hypothetical protein